MNNQGRIATNAGASLSKYVLAKVRSISKLRGIPMSRVIAFAVLNELEKDKSFDFDLTLPDISNDPPFIYADNAQKIVTFLSGLGVPQTLDFLAILHHDIGISTLDDFLLAFAECLRMGEIVEKERKTKPHGYLKEVTTYHVKSFEHKTLSKEEKEAREIEKLKKLLKKHGDKI